MTDPTTEDRLEWTVADNAKKAIEIERLTALLNDPVRLRHYIEQQMDDEAARNAIQTTEQVENDG